MPSQGIVRDCRILIQNKLLEAAPTKWWPQLSFGLEAFALRPFQSAGSNARAVVVNANTAASKALRLLRNEHLADHLGTVFDSLGLVKPSSFVNVDHSDMHGLTALVGAIQTRKGRAIPAFVETTYAQQIPAHSDKKRWQKLRAAMVAARRNQSFTGHTIDALQTMADRLSYWPKLVFDRGFGNESIVEHLSAAGAVFYIRLKAGRFVELDDGETVTRLNVKSLAERDTTIRLYGLTLRVIRSPKSRRAKEPWYILTNDQQSSGTKIVRIYYHRFEIEETFKDAKHLFELHQLRFLRPTSLKMLLWLVFLGIALLYVLTKPTKQRTGATNPKKFVSWVRRAYEQFERELMSYRALTGLTPRHWEVG
jgi:hypothetical protein